jgi:hypothetical protein
VSDLDLVVRRTSVRTADVRQAVDALYTALEGDTAAVVVLFVPPEIEREQLLAALNERFGDVPVIGCTTAGEIGPQGVGDNGIVGFSLPASHFKVAIARANDLAGFAFADGVAIAGELFGDLKSQGVEPSASQAFAMMLVDGLSAREELFTSALDGALGGIPLFGGSAGDGLNFNTTAVLVNGQFAPNSAVVMLVHTWLPFRVFKSQHVVGTSSKLVVTAADPGARSVLELDGEPAAQVYARAIGVALSDLTPDVFAAHPVVVQVGGSSCVRSIYQRNDDDSLTFFCAIDEGLVLSLAEGGDIVGTLRATLDELHRELGQLSLVVGCDCILRRLEAARLDLAEPLGRLYRDNQVVGFGTYGEQYHGMHVNQTFTGVAIGSPRREAA